MLADPRKDEDWKLQKRKGFMKDRENKNKETKPLKTKKRNSTEPLVCSEREALLPDQEKANEKAASNAAPNANPNEDVDIAPPVLQVPAGPEMPNLNASKVLDWGSLFNKELDHNC